MGLPVMQHLMTLIQEVTEGQAIQLLHGTAQVLMTALSILLMSLELKGQAVLGSNQQQTSYLLTVLEATNHGVHTLSCEIHASVEGHGEELAALDAGSQIDTEVRIRLVQES